MKFSHFNDNRDKRVDFVFEGPPPRPLEEYEYKIVDSNLLIHFLEG